MALQELEREQSTRRCVIQARPLEGPKKAECLPPEQRHDLGGLNKSGNMHMVLLHKGEIDMFSTRAYA